MDLIDRQAAIKTLEKGLPSEPLKSKYTEGITVGFGLAITWIEQLPAVQPCDDAVSRQAAIDALESIGSLDTEADKKYARSVFEALPSVQPERTCVNCGRTANNGGWYADGRTRCPIEEHYALPKDGYCHLWEKRNVTDDDYPERREE